MPENTDQPKPQEQTQLTAEIDGIRDIAILDNKQQFLTACWINGETEQDRKASEVLAKQIGEILSTLAGKRLNDEPTEYKYTSEIVAEAIRRTRADGINAPYLDMLEAMQPQKTEESSPSLPFTDLPEAEASQQQTPPDAEVLTTEEAQGIARTLQKRYPAPPYVYHSKTTLPLTALARNLHRLPLEDIDEGAAAEIGIESGALAEIPIDKRPHKRYIYMLMLNKLAEEYPITAGDKNILLALGNLYGERQDAKRTGLQGGSIITAEDIIRRYRGLDAAARIDEETIKAVESRMHMLMRLNVSFDFTQHFEYRKKELGDGEEVELDIPDDMREIDKKTGTIIRFSYHGNMVHANEIEVEYSTGRVVRAFEILAPPIVYDYAMKIKQVATIETKLLDLRKKANGSRDADVMKVYLLERITAMLDPKTHQPKPDYSNIIKLEKLFEDLRIDVQNRKKKKVKVDTLKKILDHFKDTEDKHRGTFIKGYIELKGYRGAVTGYEILF